MRQLCVFLVSATLALIAIGAATLGTLLPEIATKQLGGIHTNMMFDPDGWSDEKGCVDVCVRHTYGEPIRFLTIYLPSVDMIGMDEDDIFLKDFAARDDPFPVFRQSRTELRIAKGVYVEPGRLLAVWIPATVGIHIGIALTLMSFQRHRLRAFVVTGVCTLALFLGIQFVPVALDLRAGMAGASRISTRHDTTTLFGNDLCNSQGTRIGTEYAKQYTYGWPYPVVQFYIPFTDFGRLQPFPDFSLSHFDGPVWWTPHMSSAMVRVIPGVYINWLVSLGCWIALWAGALTPVALARRFCFKQRKPHQCKACGYDMAGLETCPECGTNLVQANSQSSE